MAFLNNAGGYTPVPDELVRRYDFTTAYVWGVIWRYAQMETGTCKASHETIAERAGMSQRSLIDHLKKLIGDGYIEDLTPNLSNKPHTYCIKKGEEKIKSTMQNLPSHYAEFAQQDEPTMQNLPSHYAEFAQPTMQNLHPKKDSEETLLRETSPLGEAVKPPKHQKPKTIPAIKVHVEVTGKWLLNKTQIKEVAEVVGDTPIALEKWRSAIRAWVMCGYNPARADGQLEWFKNGIPAYKNGATHGHSGSKSTTNATTGTGPPGEEGPITAAGTAKLARLSR